ncbi:MAG: hypothetical protein K0M45_06220 [Candidatus Paracaedibacteraceae bacterium]|nr:hypothetical protein [Candidatus Paracaedibacteraceae bacterium]
MNTLEEKIPTEEIKELTNAVFLMNGLQSKLAQESNLIATSVGQLTLISKSFQDCLTVLREQSQQIRPTIQEEATNMAKIVANDIGQQFVQASSEQIEQILNKLQITTRHIEQSLTTCNRSVNFFSRTTLILVLLSTLIGGGIGGGLVHYFIPPVSQLTKTQLEYGEFMLKVWPKMGSKDQEKLIALSKPAKKHP